MSIIANNEYININCKGCSFFLHFLLLAIFFQFFIFKFPAWLLHMSKLTKVKTFYNFLWSWPSSWPITTFIIVRFILLLLPWVFVTSAFEQDEIPYSFILVSSLKILSFTIFIVITLLGTELLWNITKVYQLCDKELNKSKATTSSSITRFMVENSINNSWKLFRCCTTLCLSLYFKLTSILIIKSLFCAVFHS